MSQYPISIIVNAIDEASKEIGDITGSVETLEEQVKRTSKAVQPLGAALTVVGGAGAVLATSSVMLAARTEELGVVLSVLGTNVGYTQAQLDRYQEGVQDLGITTISTSQSLVQMIQANIDLADATDLARLAQDTAVIAQLDSSEAFERLVHVVQRGSPLMARTLGLNVDFNRAYKEQAALIGVSVAALSQKQRIQARVNAVMEAGARVSGAYEAAMTTTAKLLRSTNRLWVEARIALGDGLLPVMEETVDITTWLLESFNALDPATKSVTGSILGLSSAVTLAAGGFILIAPKLVATATIIKAMPAFLSSLASSMSSTAATTAVLQGGVLSLGASLGVLALPLAAIASTFAIVAASMKFAKDKAQDYEAMNDHLVAALREEAEAGATAAEVVQMYAERRAFATKSVQEASWFARLFIDDQKVMTLSYEELLAVVGDNIDTAEEFAVVQKLVQDATAESTEEISTLAKTVDLAQEAVNVFKQTYSEASDETNILDRTTTALGKSLDYMAGALGDIDKSHKDLTKRNQELETSFEMLKSAIEKEQEALEDAEEVAQEAVASSERMMAGIKSAMDWTAILQKQDDYHAERAEAYMEAQADFITLEQDYNDGRQDIIRSSEEAINMAFAEYNDEKAVILRTSEEKLLVLSQKYGDDKERAQEAHEDRMATIVSSYQLRKARSRQDAHRKTLAEELEYQNSREDILLTAEARIAEIKGEHDLLRYETAENQADRVLLFRADAARAEAYAQDAVDNATDDLQKKAALLRLKLLREENAKKLAEMIANKAVLEGITEDEANEEIAKIKAERDKRLALLEEQYAEEAKVREANLLNKLARLEEDGKLALEAEKERAADRLVSLEEEFTKRGLAQNEHLNERLLALDAGWEEEQTKIGIYKAALLEQETAAYEASKTKLGEALTTRLDALEEGWGKERVAWEQHWSKMEISRLAALLKNKELTLEERLFLEETARDIAAQFALVTPDAQTFADTEIAIRDATNEASDAIFNQAGAMGALFGAMGGETTIPTYQHGVRNVPRTGLALLHEGEAVLPQHEAQAYQQGGQTGGGTSVVIHGGLVLQGVQDVPSLLEELQRYTVGEDYGF